MSILDQFRVDGRVALVTGASRGFGKVFAEALGVPVAAVGCARPDSATNAPNEHIPLPDLIRHGQLLIELMYACAAPPV